MDRFADIAHIEHVCVQHKGNGPDTVSPPPISSTLDKTELDSRPLSTEQYSACNKASILITPHRRVQSQPFTSPIISKLTVNSASQSITGNTLHDNSCSPAPECNEQRPTSHISSNVPETDMHGFLISAPGAGLKPVSDPSPKLMSSSGSGSEPGSPKPARSISLERQQKQIKEEKARLTRLQELSEMEARLEEQLQMEMAEERS